MKLLLLLALERVLGNNPFVEKGSSSHPLGVRTPTSSVFTTGEERTERFSFRGPVPICRHGREAHPSRDPFEARSSRSIHGQLNR